MCTFWSIDSMRVYRHASVPACGCGMHRCRCVQYVVFDSLHMNVCMLPTDMHACLWVFNPEADIHLHCTSYTHMYTYLYMYVHMLRYTCTCTYMYIYTYMYMNVCTVHVHVCAYAVGV